MLNLSLLLKAVPIIKEGSLSVAEFSLAAGIGKKAAAELLHFLTENEIGEIDSGFVEFEALDKMHTVMLALHMGADVEDLAKALDWRDFELLATSILDANGYVAYHGLRLKKPRVEIDVVGMKDQIALLVDCKHWEHASPSELRRFALMQTGRAETFVRANQENIRFAVPVILTLHFESVTFVDDVPVIPIIRFRSFLNEMHGYLDEIRKVPPPARR